MSAFLQSAAIEGGTKRAPLDRYFTRLPRTGGCKSRHSFLVSALASVSRSGRRPLLAGHTLPAGLSLTCRLSLRGMGGIFGNIPASLGSQPSDALQVCFTRLATGTDVAPPVHLPRPFVMSPTHHEGLRECGQRLPGNGQ